MGLFDKKYCSICGEKIHLFGNRKLSDGNLCGDCESKLSPWFSERRESTVDEIRDQIEYRENNMEAVCAFNTTRTLGTYTKIHFDEGAKKFMVTSATNLAKANPDVMDFSQITGCRIDIKEDQDELMCKDAEGNSVSYNPPQYSKSYDFYVVLDVNSPYFNEIRFKLNNSDVTMKPDIRVAAAAPVQNMMPQQQSAPSRPGMPQPQHGAPSRPGMPQQGAPTRPGMPQQGAPTRPGMPQHGGAPSRPGMPQQGAPARPGMPQHNVPQHGGPARPGMPQQGAPMPQPQAQQAPAAASVSNQVISSYMPDPMSHADYARFYQMGEEIRSILLGVQEDVRSEMAAANEVPQAVTCPWCGATTIPTANGTCEYCGGSVR